LLLAGSPGKVKSMCRNSLSSNRPNSIHFNLTGQKYDHPDRMVPTSEINILINQSGNEYRY